MVRYWFIQVIADIPAMRHVHGDALHHLPFRADTFKEHDELQFEEDDRVNRRTATGRSIVRLHEVIHEPVIKVYLNLAIEGIMWYKLLE